MRRAARERSPDRRRETALDVAPLVPRDHARDQVEGEVPLEPLLLAVDGEADALVEERDVDAMPALLELFDAERRELFSEHAVVRPRPAGRFEHLVEERARLVATVEREDGCLGGRGHGYEAPSPVARVGDHAAARLDSLVGPVRRDVLTYPQSGRRRGLSTWRVRERPRPPREAAPQPPRRPHSDVGCRERRGCASDPLRGMPSARASTLAGLAGEARAATRRQARESASTS
jgi:hypothetical protein